MKMLKKIFRIFLSVLMMSLGLPVCALADNTESNLQFNSDGQFKILVFADIQDDEDVEQSTLQLMAEALDACEPDLVVLLGDNTVATGYENQYKAIEAVTEPIRSRNIPYAMVFGNHDQEQGVDKETLLAVYQEFGCLTYDADPGLYGCGTCNLPILSSDGTETAFNLWFIDSGSQNSDADVGGYDYVHEDQIQWYKDTASALKEANGGETVPAINFQHIVIPEIYDTLYNRVSSSVSKSLTLNFMGNSYSYIPKFTGYTGLVCEAPCPPYVKDGQLDAWLETGDIIAAFHGHDHINTYEAECSGIDVINVPSAGSNAYYRSYTRGVGLITLDESSPENYEYELLHIYDFALQDGSLLGDVEGGMSKISAFFNKLFYNFLTGAQSLLNTIVSPFRTK
ncbi:MAG: metallophosphoesterase [Clostridiales bacterium]|nr:metallophosphoesterase [Clostridiales bacterium]